MSADRDALSGAGTALTLALVRRMEDAPFIEPDPFGQAMPATLGGERFCRECGCTQFNACVHPEHGACWWVEPDLCSHCANGWNKAGGA
jgi:hypothetical protein